MNRIIGPTGTVSCGRLRDAVSCGRLRADSRSRLISRTIVDDPALWTGQAYRGIVSFAFYLRPATGGDEQRNGGDEDVNQSGNLVHGK